MTDPIKWFISILAACAESRKYENREKQGKENGENMWKGEECESEEGRRREEKQNLGFGGFGLR
jgi:hypothetical protein